MTDPSVFIVVVNWNGWKDTIECLDSLLKNNYQNYQVIVVDNHSEDESYEKISEWCRDRAAIKIMQTRVNLGFAGGSNVGIRYALSKRADYILLLNNDTTVEADFLTNLVNTAEADSDAGIISGKILYSHNKKIWYLGGKIAWLRGGGYHPGKGKADRTSKEAAPFEVDFISGCMMLIKREVFEKIGFLDESYFLYNEDVEFCLRASRADIKMVANPASVIYHKERSTCGGWKPYHIYYLIRNKLILMKRYAPNSVLLLCFYFIVAIMGCVLSLRWIFKRRFDLIRAYGLAIHDFSNSIDGKLS